MKRRDLVKVAGISAMGLSLAQIPGVARLVGSSLKPYELKTPEASFVMLTGNHGMNGIAEGLIPVTKESQSIDALFCETGNLRYILDADTKEQAIKDANYYFDSAKDGQWLKEIVTYMEAHNKPLLFGDLPYKHFGLGPAAHGISSMAAYAGAVGGAALAVGKDQQMVSRREFPKRLLGVAFAGGGYSKLLSDVLKAYPDFIRQPWAQQVRELASVGEMSHPEDYIVTLRNAAIASKLLNYSHEQKRKGHIPKIGVAMGAGHEFITEYLKKGKMFCDRMTGLYPDSFLQTLYGDEYKAYLSTLVELHKGEPVKRFVDSELASKWKNKESEMSGNSETLG